MASSEERVTYNPCQGFGCHEHCILEVHSRDGKIVRTQRAPLPSPAPGPRICSKGIMSAKIPYTHDRLLKPLKRIGERGSGQWEEISWDQAFEEIGAKLNAITEQYGSHATILNTFWCGVPGCDRSTNFDLAMRFLNSFGATRLEGPSIDMSTILATLTDLNGIISNNRYLLNECNDHIIIWASNPIGFTRPGETSHMFMDARERGCKITHISNLFDVTSAKVDHWVPVKSGTDAALALAMAKTIIDENLQNDEALVKRTTAAYLVREDNGRYLHASDVVEGGNPAEYVYVDVDTGEICFAGRHVAKAAVGAIGSSVATDSIGATSGGVATEAEQSEEERLKGYAASDVYGDHTPDLRASVEVNGIACRTVFLLLIDHLEGYTPEFQEGVTGVPAETCRELAREYATVPTTMFIYDGLRYANATQTARAIYLLVYLTGQMGAKGATILPSPLDYYPTTQLNINPLWYPDENIHRADQVPWVDVIDSFGNPDAPQQYKALINPYANPILNWPNKDMWYNQVLPNLDLFVAVDIRMSDTCKYADYVLPETTTYERWEVLPGPNECIIMCEPAIEPVGESRDIAQIFAGLAKATGVGDLFGDKSLEFWAKFKISLPGTSGQYLQAPLTAEEDPEHAGELADVTVERLEKAKFLHLDVAEEQFDNYRGIAFDTPSGKVEFYNENFLPLGKAFADFEPALVNDEAAREKYPLQFYPGRHKYFMQSQFTNIPELVSLATATQSGLALNPVEAAARGLKDGDEVEVVNQRGVIKTTLRLREDIAPGIAHMWYSFNEDKYPGSSCPQHLMVSQNTREVQSAQMGAITTAFAQTMASFGVPRSASFFVENAAPEIIWDALCEVRKAGE
ncbi:molybdopterin-dependent oxidoreductase [Adlercreutzia sp. ZJ473]|uniref:molybdopterin-containing oxidoreductase family protein n=1 Tax=Adlercreutzia sp. ZJ473 TaxID=2722822 RepID=UPI001553096D|nr:molybdopterin-dependent oxidoreductase [Adlercreutzia sp. ZJ473]